jgi:hypothetical protein
MHRGRLADRILTAALNWMLLTTIFAVAAHANCQLDSASGKIKHVVYIEFDNVHFTRDNPNVPSDLEQMPNLLNFVSHNGTLDAGDHTVLISHTANGILTTETGVYPDRHGIGVANNFGVFVPPNGVEFPSSFFYWTDLVNDIDPFTHDSLPALLTETQENEPAPWVPFTRAGCDVGAFSTANIVLERTPFDVVKVFGQNSSQSKEDSNHQTADFIGEAIHCAGGSALCTAANDAVDDLLPDEPGGYAGFKGLFGAKYINRAFREPLEDLNGNVLKNVDSGLVGFTGFDPLATQTLGAVATMLEKGVPVVFAYIMAAHENLIGAFGPGQAPYVAKLKSYNKAFGQFFARLKADGINQSNTLFVFTPDEGDHFVGGPASPSGCDGVTTPCTYSQIGELDINLNGLVSDVYSPQTPPPFSIHFDSAPTGYVEGQPDRTDPAVRQLEQVIGQLTAINPITHRRDHLTAALADPIEERMLHMVTADPLRTPTFTMFGDPDYFFLSSGSTKPTEFPTEAWNHGDFQREIARTFIGIVGPGVRNLGITHTFFSDHTDLRPTIISLVGLRDDYVHDGRVLVEALDPSALPQALRAHEKTLLRLGQVYKQINAPFGRLGLNTLKISTHALESDSTNDTIYTHLENQVESWIDERDALANQMRRMLEGAEFSDEPIDEARAKDLINDGEALLRQSADLASSL